MLLHKRRISRSLCVVFFLLLWCWSSIALAQVRWMKAEDGAPMWVGQGKALVKAFSNGVSPILHGATFARLGVRWDGPQNIYLMARYSQDGKQWSSWLPMQRPWEEGTVHNSHGDPPSATAKYAQMKVVGEGHPTFMAAVLIPKVGPYQYKPAVTVVPPKEGKSSSQSFGLSGPFNPRSKWGAKAAKCTRNNNTKTRIAIHHTVTPNQDSVSVEVRLRGIQSFHQGTRGWCDIGYHLLVSSDGQAWEGTPAEFLGTHVGGNNTNTLGISFIGTFDAVTPNSKMLCTGAKLIDWAVKTFGVKRNRTAILGHRQFQGNSTSCPGTKLFGQIDFMVTQSSSSNCTAPPPPKCDYVQISTATLNIRNDANTSQPPIGTVTQGTCLKVLAKKSGQSVSGNTTWYQISHNGKTGWISGHYAPCSNCGPPADTKLPTVKITAPNEGAIVKTSPFAVKGEAKDNVGVTKVEVNGKPATLDANGNFQLDLALPNGKHVLTATAWDKAGNKGTATVNITVELTTTPDGNVVDAGSEPAPDTAVPQDQGTPQDKGTSPDQAGAIDRAGPRDSGSPDRGSKTDTAPADKGTASDGRLVLDGGGAPSCRQDTDCKTGLRCIDGKCILPPGGFVPGGGCSCDSQGGSPALWGLLMLGLFLMGRRRKAGQLSAASQ